MDLYLWIKALHVIAVIAWMAGILYLPRLFVYHANVAAQSESAELFKVMERRLANAIMTPAMIATWVFGIWLLVLTPAWLSDPWMHVKLLAVVLMTGAHGALTRWRKAFAVDANRHSSKFYRIFNEIPTVLMIVVVIMVIGKPF